jgi:hypothetical protein
MITLIVHKFARYIVQKSTTFFLSFSPPSKLKDKDPLPSSYVCNVDNNFLVYDLIYMYTTFGDKKMCLPKSIRSIKDNDEVYTI